VTDLPYLHIDTRQQLRSLPDAEDVDATRDSGLTEEAEEAIAEAFLDGEFNFERDDITIQLRRPGGDEPAPAIGEFAYRANPGDAIWICDSAEEAQAGRDGRPNPELWEVVSRVVLLVDGDRYEGPWKTLAETEAAIEAAEAAAEKRRIDELAGPR